MLYEKKVKFVFKPDICCSDYNIHGKEYSSFFTNLNQLGMVETYSSENLPTENFVYEYQQQWDISPEVYFGEEGFMNFDPCPKNVLDRIKNKTAHLVISIPYESPIQPNRLIKIHEYIKKINLPSSQIIYFTCCLNAADIYKDFCIKRGEEPVLQFDYMIENLFNFHKFSNDLNFEYKPGFRKKTFLMFNRRGHPHRALFLYNIHKMKMLDSFYISFSKNEVDHNYSYSQLVKNFYNNYYYKQENLLDYNILEDLENKLPLILDTHDLVTSNLMYDKFDSTKKLYDESFVHLISETYFDSNIIHLTEKTFKPILYKQPFILLGPPYMLKHLRNMGFKTFNILWDESYDLTENNTERFYKILNLCKIIYDWPMLKKISMMHKCKEIIEHNFNMLVNFRKEKFILKEIIEKYNLA